MGIWYRAGMVAVTSGSKTVTGTGTQWQNLIFGVAPGVTFYGPDGKPYEIDTVNSNTSLTLVTNYSGATASAQAYAVDPTRTGSVASLAAQTSEVLKFSQKQFTQVQTWFTGAANADVTLESPAGQTITVPSYSKVTSEGEGQAARAKVEADRAKTEADRAAAAAGGSITTISLPLPDPATLAPGATAVLTGTFAADVTSVLLTVDFVKGVKSWTGTVISANDPVDADGLPNGVTWIKVNGSYVSGAYSAVTQYIKSGGVYPPI